MNKDDRLVRNPSVALREEFDDWAVLFNPDAAVGFGGFGLNPSGICVWKLLDGEHSIDELVEALRHCAEGVPEDAREHAKVFVDALVAEGLAAYGDTGSYQENSHALLGPSNEMRTFTYEPPKLVNLSSGRAALGACSNHGSHGGNCTGGAGATGSCCSGTCGTTPSCCSGTCDTASCGSGANPQAYVCGYGSTNPVMCNCYSYGANATSCQYGTAAGTCSTGNSH